MTIYWTHCSRLFLSTHSAKLKEIFWKMYKIIKIKKKTRWQIYFRIIQKMLCPTYVWMPPVHKQHKESMLCQTNGVSIYPIHLDAPWCLDTPLCLGATISLDVPPVCLDAPICLDTPTCLDAHLYVWTPPCLHSLTCLDMPTYWMSSIC